MGTSSEGLDLFIPLYGLFFPVSWHVVVIFISCVGSSGFANYNPEIKYPGIMYGYGMPGTQIIWNRWGRTLHQYLAQKGFIVFAMDTRGMGGRGEKFKNLTHIASVVISFGTPL